MIHPEAIELNPLKWKPLAATRQPDGTYTIDGRMIRTSPWGTFRKTKTYDHRTTLAKYGKWNSSSKNWEGFKEEDLEACNAIKTMKVRVMVDYDGCKWEQECRMGEDEIKASLLNGLHHDFCGRCDSQCGSKILEVIGE